MLCFISRVCLSAKSMDMIIQKLADGRLQNAGLLRTSLKLYLDPLAHQAKLLDPLDERVIGAEAFASIIIRAHEAD
ncbi:hypothetical protein TCAL_17261 [Tigriopus californicus]|uniref:Uncharacterized protein n=1 Tax=Tigriopus californicus TaxID=6832 RepID=A0A553NZG7_TIGCA|nr:hypothetical protein TCAL_17261 [Tigriopus californicus]